MKLTPLGVAVAIGLGLWLAWKLVVWKWGDATLPSDLEGLEITPVDIMVFIAIGFVGLLLTLYFPRVFPIVNKRSPNL